MEGLEISESVTYDVPEHQVLFNFNSDMMSAAFVEWWYEEGQLLFNRYWSKEQE